MGRPRRASTSRYRPPVSAPTTFSEPFTTSLALTWTPLQGGGTVTVQGGTQGTLSGSGITACARADHDLGTPDMFSQITWVSGATTGDHTVGVATRCSATVETFYMFEANVGQQAWSFQKFTSGTRTNISNNVSRTITLPVTVRLESQGSTHRCYLNGVLVGTFTDTSITAGQRGGIYGFNDDNLTRFDDFSTGGLTAAITPITLTATPQAGQVTCQWSTTRTDITGWLVGRNGTDTAGTGPWSTELPAAQTSIVFDKLTSGTTYTFTLTPHTAAGDLTALTATAAPTTGTVDPPPVSTGNWLSGASLDSAANGAFGTWRGLAIACGGTWADSADAQTNLWSIQPGAEWGSFTGAMDIAIGGIYTSRGESWAAAASGAYDARFTSVFQKLNQLRSGRGTSFIRFAHELNGNWYEWSINSGNVAAFKTAWQRVYAIKQAQFPQCKLVFCTNYESTGGVAWPNMWPGDQYVDVLGVDYYNQYAVQVNSSADWTTKLNNSATVGGTSEPHGLGAYRQWAQDHGKPLGIGEWAGNSESVGADNPAFITGMLNYISSNAGPGAGQFVYEVYFNGTPASGWGRFGLWPTTNMPSAADAYNAFF